MLPTHGSAAAGRSPAISSAMDSTRWMANGDQIMRTRRAGTMGTTRDAAAVWLRRATSPDLGERLTVRDALSGRDLALGKMHILRQFGPLEKGLVGVDREQLSLIHI